MRFFLGCLVTCILDDIRFHRVEENFRRVSVLVVFAVSCVFTCDLPLDDHLRSWLSPGSAGCIIFIIFMAF